MLTRKHRLRQSNSHRDRQPRPGVERHRAGQVHHPRDPRSEVGGRRPLVRRRSQLRLLEGRLQRDHQEGNVGQRTRRLHLQSFAGRYVSSVAACFSTVPFCR
jgi:hypothetical protein